MSSAAGTTSPGGSVWRMLCRTSRTGSPGRVAIESPVSRQPSRQPNTPWCRTTRPKATSLTCTEMTSPPFRGAKERLRSNGRSSGEWNDSRSSSSWELWKTNGFAGGGASAWAIEAAEPPNSLSQIATVANLALSTASSVGAPGSGWFRVIAAIAQVPCGSTCRVACRNRRASAWSTASTLLAPVMMRALSLASLGATSMPVATNANIARATANSANSR